MPTVFVEFFCRTGRLVVYGFPTPAVHSIIKPLQTLLDSNHIGRSITFTSAPTLQWDDTHTLYQVTLSSTQTSNLDIERILIPQITDILTFNNSDENSQWKLSTCSKSYQPVELWTICFQNSTISLSTTNSSSTTTTTTNAAELSTPLQSVSLNSSATPSSTKELNELSKNWKIGSMREYETRATLTRRAGIPDQFTNTNTNTNTNAASVPVVVEADTSSPVIINTNNDKKIKNKKNNKKNNKKKNSPREDSITASPGSKSLDNVTNVPNESMIIPTASVVSPKITTNAHVNSNSGSPAGMKTMIVDEDEDDVDDDERMRRTEMRMSIHVNREAAGEMFISLSAMMSDDEEETEHT